MNFKELIEENTHPSRLFLLGCILGSVLLLYFMWPHLVTFHQVVPTFAPPLFQ